MHFERSLRRSIYAPWKEYYIDYPKLKQLLRDDGSDAGSVAGHDDGDEWTEDDEGAFVEELVNVQLEKVHNFQGETIAKLRERTSNCETKLDGVAGSKSTEKDGEAAPEETEKAPTEDEKKTLKEVLAELDGVTKEMNELEKFSRINYTGFLKATKKHDRRRGHSYRVRPLMQVRLSALPFNKEDYSPLLFRLSTMYSFCRQHLEGKDKPGTFSESHLGNDDYRSYRFWVHLDNLLELKTMILRRLPVLIYNPQTSKIAEGAQKDPTITSIYFDNPQFSLYNAKASHTWPASSLRVRWYDSLSSNPEIYLEKKTVDEDDTSHEQKFTTKPKYIQKFLQTDYRMDKDVQRLRDSFGDDSEQVRQLQANIDEIKNFVQDNDLQPVLRANYTRQAFQIPGDNRVRITLDTNLALIREDALDPDLPCRDPSDWHRKDIDDIDMEFPFSGLRKGEINRFPFAVLEIRVKGDKNYEWVTDLMNSHLVKTAPRFSKFVHGVAQLFDDYVNTFPFWLNEVDTDIRKDAHQAFEEEQERRAKAAEDEVAVGSLLKHPSLSKSPFRSPIGSPSSPKHQQPHLLRKATAQSTRVYDAATKESKNLSHAADDDSEDEDRAGAGDARGLRSYLPSLSMSKYAQSRRHAKKVTLPAGVKEPSFWIKDEGPVKVEAKVWLANQRTFIKWQHVAVLLASLSLGLFNAASDGNNVARTLGVVYTLLAVFIAVWGLGIYVYRVKLIQQRSGKDFDNIIGPIVVCVSLAVALCFNFGFKVRLNYQAIMQEKNPREQVVGIATGSMYVAPTEL